MNGRLCAAHKKNGDPCGKYPIAGGSVCRFHGGAAPQVRRKAEERIREAADPAAAKLVELMSSPEVPYNVQLQAARDLLDRAGISSAQPIQLEIKPWAQNLDGLLADTVVDVIEGEVLEIAPAPAEVAPPRAARVREAGPPQYGRRPAEARRRGRPPS
jgi:hypothetical protein